MMATSSVLNRGSSDHLGAGLCLELAGVEVLCLPGGGLWLASAGAMVVADLHLEKGSSYAWRGQMLPPYDTHDTLGRLAVDIAALSPRRLIFLGDSFHDAAAETRLIQTHRELIVALSANREVIWISGNHDRDGPKGLPGERVATLILAGLRFVHEPTGADGLGEVAGHLHPCARVRARGASIRRRCFVTDGRRMILPAFGAFAGGLNVLDPAFASLLGDRPLACVLGQGKVHPIGWKSLTPD